jgi:glycosyltransferase involved in cell wall biosynthesis
MNPIVSIVIPCYNAAALIGDAIRSALGQTYPETEVIVVDDGSTDDSVNIVRSFGPRVRCEAGPHRGAPAARNRGLSVASGDWIQFLDADDLLFPEKIEKQIQARPKDSDSIVFCDYDEVETRAGAIIQATRAPFDGGDPIPFILRRQIGTAAPLHPKKWLTAVGGFDETLPCAQEYDLHLRLACRGATFVYLPLTLCRVRKQASSLSSNYIKILNQYPNILSRSYDMLKTAETLTDERARAFAETMARTGRHYLQRGHPEEGRRAFQLARQMHTSGGLGAYRWPARLLFHLCGPVLTETLTSRKRKFLGEAAP